jgi:hypothetical protein
MHDAMSALPRSLRHGDTALQYVGVCIVNLDLVLRLIPQYVEMVVKWRHTANWLTLGQRV